jgi:DNA-binding response OmpR family regulator
VDAIPFASPIRILIVDQPQQPKLISALQQQGHELHHVSDPAQVLALVAALAPEIALIAVPRAASICRQLRDDRLETAVVVLAASSDVAERIDALNAGADDCVGTPFRMPELAARLYAARRRALRRLRPTDIDRRPIAAEGRP